MVKQAGKRVVAVLLLLLVMTLTGCATTNGLIKEADLKLEVIDSSTVRITHASLQTSAGTLTLHGDLERRIAAHGPIPGHLHVDLLDPEGTVIKEIRIGYRYKGAKSHKATFNLPLPAALPVGSTLRVTHHDLRSHQSEATQPTWEEVNVIDEVEE